MDSSHDDHAAELVDMIDDLLRQCSTLGDELEEARRQELEASRFVAVERRLRERRVNERRGNERRTSA
jgi:hypothetical protein